MNYNTESWAAQARIMQANPEPPVRRIFCDICEAETETAYWLDEHIFCPDCFRDYALEAIEAMPTEALADVMNAEIWEE